MTPALEQIKALHERASASALADTQRAIIEAAERRGYERGVRDRAAEAAPQGGDTPVRRYHFRMVSDHHAWGYHLIPAEDGAYCKYSEVRQVLLAAQLAATPPSAPAVDRDWYTDEAGVIHIDWDHDPARQLSLMLKPDGKVGWAICIGGEGCSGLDAMAPEFMDAIRRLSAPVPQEGVDEAMVERALRAFWQAYGEQQRGGRQAGRTAAGIRAVLALAAGALPQGVVLVPKEPTEEMVDAGADISVPSNAYHHSDIDIGERAARECWAAMLVAAPAQGVR